MRSTRWRDRPNRIDTAIPAVMIDSHGSQQPVEIVDLSSSGFRLRAGAELAEDADITLRVDRYGDFPRGFSGCWGFTPAVGSPSRCC